MPADTAFMDKLVALCKRRGFIFQSSEIYGGIGGFWDYGPLGVELKRNIKNQWWHDHVTNPPNGPDGKEIQMVGLDCSIIMKPKVWEASGHATGFADPMVDCKACKARFRADQLYVTVFGRPVDDPTLREQEDRKQTILARKAELRRTGLDEEAINADAEIVRLVTAYAAQSGWLLAKCAQAQSWHEAAE